MTPSNRDCFFTSIALNYLSKALALTTSVFAVHHATRMVIAIVDYRWLSAAQRDRLAAIARQFSANGSQLEFLDPLTLYERPDLFRYKFNVVEACTSVKPAVAMALLDTAETVTYLDPDTFMYSPLPAHPDANDVWDVQLTPHVLAPAGKDGLISERLFMFYGTFNLGYFAVRRSAQSMKFLAWWKQFCVDFGADAPQAGLFVDQKPVDLLPSFIDRPDVLRHPGCNMAWWNIFCDGRHLEDDGRTVTFDDHASALVFFHFSNLDREPDASKRLVANPLHLYADSHRRSRRMMDQPALERLYADYEASVAPWTAELATLTVPDGLKHRTHDAPLTSRLLLSEALRRGMSYPGDPFEQSALSVAWRSLMYVLPQITRHDVKSVLSAVLGVARLGLTSRVFRHTN